MLDGLWVIGRELRTGYLIIVEALEFGMNVVYAEI